VTREAEWRREWEVLRAERALARREWRSATDGLSAWSCDPFGIGGLLARLLPGGAPEREAPDPSWRAVLRDAALGFAVPWILDRLKGGR
jgi:hypothetical protein